MRFGAAIGLVLMFGLAAVVSSVSRPVRAAELVMFDAPSCEWCEAWEEEVGVIYTKTDEARSAPLRRIDIDAPRTGALTKIRPIMYTPTFVLMDNDKEVGRIMGYPGEENFWGLLGVLIAKVKTPVSGCATTHVASNDSAKTPVCWH